jgi:hypothetical protein
MQCSTWLYCCNEKINATRQQIIGTTMSLSTANRHGYPRAPITETL